MGLLDMDISIHAVQDGVHWCMVHGEEKMIRFDRPEDIMEFIDAECLYRRQMGDRERYQAAMLLAEAAGRFLRIKELGSVRRK